MRYFFQIFAYFLICFSFLHCTDKPKPDGTEETETKINISNEVQYEMKRFRSLIDLVPNSQKRGKLEGMVEELMYRAIRAEIRGKKLLKNEIRLENKKKKLEVFARKQAIPTRLKHQAEIFPQNYLSSLDGTMKRLGDINNQLFNSMLNPILRRTYLENCALKLASFASTPNEKFESEFPKALKRLQDLDPKLEWHTQNTTLLQESLLKLYNSKDTNEGQQIWRFYKEKIWTPISEMNLSPQHIMDISGLCLLSGETVLSTLLSETFEKVITLTSEEIAYAYDTLFLGNLFKKELSKQYKQCICVFYKSSDIEVKQLQALVENKWPNKNRAERYDTYCQKFSELYNLVADLDRHRPGLIPPPNCKPTLQDFREYIEHLSAQGGESLGFVAETLYSPKFRHKSAKLYNKPGEILNYLELIKKHNEWILTDFDL